VAILTEAERRAFILVNTRNRLVPFIPEISLHLADEAFPLWQKTEAELEEIGLPPPYWAFAWAGGQALARYCLDNPGLLQGKTVLDMATGSGLVAIAASIAGARRVVANDIDRFSQTAALLNAKANNTCLDWQGSDLLNQPEADLLKRVDIILAGDVFYDREMVKAFHEFLSKCCEGGKTVIVGDPGRSYFPQKGLERLQQYSVPVTRELEDLSLKETSVWQYRQGR
jgi:predicted nicotinamide N-methyase